MNSRVRLTCLTSIVWLATACTGWTTHQSRALPVDSPIATLRVVLRDGTQQSRRKLAPDAERTVDERQHNRHGGWPNGAGSDLARRRACAAAPWLPSWSHAGPRCRAYRGFHALRDWHHGELQTRWCAMTIVRRPAMETTSSRRHDAYTTRQSPDEAVGRCHTRSERARISCAVGRPCATDGVNHHAPAEDRSADSADARPCCDHFCVRVVAPTRARVSALVRSTVGAKRGPPSRSTAWRRSAVKFFLNTHS